MNNFAIKDGIRKGKLIIWRKFCREQQDNLRSAAPSTLTGAFQTSDGHRARC